MMISESIDSESENTKHTQSAGVIIFDGDQVLILRSGSKWSFPKGGLEDGESLMDAAIRETQEETGLVLDRDYELTGETTPAITYKSKMRTGPDVSIPVIKTASFFVGKRLGDTDPVLLVNPDLGYPEHEEWRWVKVSDLFNNDQEVGPVMTPKLLPVIKSISMQSS